MSGKASAFSSATSTIAGIIFLSILLLSIQLPNYCIQCVGATQSPPPPPPDPQHHQGTAKWSSLLHVGSPKETLEEKRSSLEDKQENSESKIIHLQDAMSASSLNPTEQELHDDVRHVFSPQDKKKHEDGGGSNKRETRAPSPSSIPVVYPQCSEQKNFRLIGRSFTLMTLKNVSYFRLDCFGFIITPLVGVNCPRTHDPSSYEFYFEAVPVGSTSASRALIPKVHLGTLYGGSVSGTSYSFPRGADIYLRFRHSSLCVMLMSMTLAGEAHRNSRFPPLPAILQLNPFAAYAKRPASFRFAITSPSSQGPTPTVRETRPPPPPSNTAQRRQGKALEVAISPQTLKLIAIPSHLTCKDNGADIFKNYAGSFPAISDVSTTEMRGFTTFNWSFTFDQSGSFAVCASYGPNAGTIFHEIAYMDVFGGNPSFFYVPGYSGYLVAGIKYKLVFEGHNLDLRPGADEAKIVEHDVSCTAGTAGSTGIVLVGGLQPAGKVGVSAASIFFTSHQSTMYRVCYKRVGRTWLEVPFLDSLGYHSRNVVQNKSLLLDLDQKDEVNPAAVNYTSYTASPAKCPTAPPRTVNQPAGNYLRMTLATDSLPFNFVTWLADFLCIPQPFVKVYDIEVVAPLKTLVIMDIRCLNDVCDSRERMNYVIYIFSTNPRKLIPIEVTNIEEVEWNGISIEKPSSSPSDSKKGGKKDDNDDGVLITILIAGILGVIIIVLLIVLIGYCAYKRNHVLVRAVDDSDTSGLEMGDDATNMPHPETIVRGVVMRPAEQEPADVQIVEKTL